MTDQEIIRRAVELADGWVIDDDHAMPWIDVKGSDGHILFTTLLDADDEGFKYTLDSLAAQLVRQVDALILPDGWFRVRADKGWATVHEMNGFTKREELAAAYGPDRTMNTLRAIVESGVLDE